MFVCVYVCAGFLFFAVTNRASTVSRVILYAYVMVASPVGGLLARRRSEEHLQSSSDSIENKNKTKMNAFNLFREMF